MALPPKFKGHRLVLSEAAAVGATGYGEQPHTVELYLDYVCPYSAKMFKTIYSVVAPAVRKDPELSKKVQFIFRHQIQPWHPASTLAHEAGLAVLRLTNSDSERFWKFSAALFEAQAQFFDESVAREPRNDTYRRLAALAAESAGVSANDAYDLLKVGEKEIGAAGTNGGNQVTNDLKTSIKIARLVSVHVSPTVIFDGVVAPEFSSSWGEQQWIEWLRKNAN